jgi:hypothetical protein
MHAKHFNTPEGMPFWPLPTHPVKKAIVEVSSDARYGVSKKTFSLELDISPDAFRTPEDFAEHLTEMRDAIRDVYVLGGGRVSVTFDFEKEALALEKNLQDRVNDHIEIHLRATGPVSFNSICAWLLEQTPGITDDNVEEFALRALDALHTLGAITQTVDELERQEFDSPEELKKNAYYESTFLPFTVTTRFFNSPENKRTYWIDPETRVRSSETFAGEFPILHPDSIILQPATPEEKENLKENLAGEGGYRLGPRLMAACGTFKTSVTQSAPERSTRI